MNRKLLKMHVKKMCQKTTKNWVKKITLKKLVWPKNAHFGPQNTNHLKINVYTMIGFGSCEFFVKNEIVQVFLTVSWILLTDAKITQNVLKKHKKCKFFNDYLDWLLKLGLIFDTRTWKIVGNKMYGKISMKILKIVNCWILGGASVHFFR